MTQKEIRRIAVTIDFMFDENNDQQQMEANCVDFFTQFLKDFPAVVEYIEDMIPEKEGWINKMGLSSFDTKVAKARTEKH